MKTAGSSYGASCVETKNRFDLSMRPELAQAIDDAYRAFLASEMKLMAQPAFRPKLVPRSDSCPLCKENDTHTVLRAQSLNHLCCQRCGFVFTDRVAETSADKVRYRRGDAASLRLSLVRHPAWRMLEHNRAGYLLTRLAECGVQRGRLLDVGSGAGNLLSAASGAGFSAEGIEINEAYRAVHEEGGLCVHYGDFPADFSPERLGVFDAITMLDVLEHTEDPVSFLAETARYLSAGGLLAVQTPNFDSLLLQIEGAENHNFCSGHWNHFTPETLARAGSEAGLRPLLVDTYITELHRIRTKPWPVVADAFFARTGIELPAPESLTPERLYAHRMGYKAFAIFARPT